MRILLVKVCHFLFFFYITTDIAISSKHKESLISKINVTAINSITRERCMKMVKRFITYYNIIVLFL